MQDGVRRKTKLEVSHINGIVMLVVAAKIYCVVALLYNSIPLEKDPVCIRQNIEHSSNWPIYILTPLPCLWTSYSV